MAEVPVLSHASHGHVEALATAVAEGARGAGADVGRVPETVATQSRFKLDQPAPVATGAELADDGARHQGLRVAKTATKLFG